MSLKRQWTSGRKTTPRVAKPIASTKLFAYFYYLYKCSIIFTHVKRDTEQNVSLSEVLERMHVRAFHSDFLVVYAHVFSAETIWNYCKMFFLGAFPTNMNKSQCFTKEASSLYVRLGPTRTSFIWNARIAVSIWWEKRYTLLQCTDFANEEFSFFLLFVFHAE